MLLFVYSLYNHMQSTLIILVEAKLISNIEWPIFIFILQELLEIVKNGDLAFSHAIC